ncbi:uncharacterized protein LOC129234456 [Uloborus diversus]|uniref:uncharacterized protein LOC129234456 n=1 Tax=Uloborus diversus TaxID=327109 RepID=UPI00240A2FDC|nr:uncharacterized protein LOC129234456 [Uloborus diversus]
MQSNITSDLKFLFRGYPFPRSADLVQRAQEQVWIPTKANAPQLCSVSNQFLCLDNRCVSEYWMCDATDESLPKLGAEDAAPWKKRRLVFHVIVGMGGIFLVILLFLTCLCSFDDETLYRLSQRESFSTKRNTVVHKKSKSGVESSPLLSASTNSRMQETV